MNGSDVLDHPGSITPTAEFQPEFHPHQSQYIQFSRLLGQHLLSAQISMQMDPFCFL